MVKNMGSIDRGVRAVAGVALLLLAFFGGLGTLLSGVCIVLGLVMLGTSAVGFCPLYKPFGINTNK